MTEELKSASAETPPACLSARFRKSRLNPNEASDYLLEAHGIKVATATLNKARSVGGGPAFLKFGRAVMYERAAIDAWVSERLGSPHRSTATA